MRLHITNDKSVLVDMICHYLSDLLVGNRVDLIINGTKSTGIIKSVTLENDEHSYIVLKINKDVRKIPILEDTKARFGKDLVVFDTAAHTTVIEILNS